jgi:hypothetical protein
VAGRGWGKEGGEREVEGKGKGHGEGGEEREGVGNKLAILKIILKKPSSTHKYNFQNNFHKQIYIMQKQ